MFLQNLYGIRITLWHFHLILYYKTILISLRIVCEEDISLSFSALIHLTILLLWSNIFIPVKKLWWNKTQPQPLCWLLLFFSKITSCCPCEPLIHSDRRVSWRPRPSGYAGCGQLLSAHESSSPGPPESWGFWQAETALSFLLQVLCQSGPGFFHIVLVTALYKLWYLQSFRCDLGFFTASKRN